MPDSLLLCRFLCFICVLRTVMLRFYRFRTWFWVAALVANLVPVVAPRVDSVKLTRRKSVRLEDWKV